MTATEYVSKESIDSIDDVFEDVLIAMPAAALNEAGYKVFVGRDTKTPIQRVKGEVTVSIKKVEVTDRETQAKRINYTPEIVIQVADAEYKIDAPGWLLGKDGKSSRMSELILAVASRLSGGNYRRSGAHLAYEVGGNTYTLEEILGKATLDTPFVLGTATKTLHNVAIAVEEYVSRDGKACRGIRLSAERFSDLL